MQASFQEFLRKKTEGSNWKDRKSLRTEWLGALHQLLGQIQDWLKESDPDGVLECVTYTVQRVEERLGVYDAPALSIRLNTESADVRPMGRFATLPFSFRQMLIDGHTDLRLSGGCVEITNDERRYFLMRTDDESQWYTLATGQHAPASFDKARLEKILEDLLQ